MSETLRADHQTWTVTLLRWLTNRPGAATLCLLGVTLLAGVLAATGLKIEGDVAKALRGDSQAFRDYSSFEERFGAPSKDEVLLVQTEDFGAPGQLLALEDLVIELQLTPGVAGVLSVFSIPDPDGSAPSFLARGDLAGLPGAERIDRLLKDTPLAAQAMAADRTTTLITVIPDQAVAPEDRLSALTAALSFADPALSVSFVGLAALQREITVALAADQLFLAPAAIIVCLGLSLLLFRSWRAALLCAAPAILALGWTFGLLAATGTPMGPLMAIVPTVLIVLGIADSVHVYHAVQKCGAEMPLRDAVIKGTHDTLPAIVLTTVTTALAFLSLLFVGSPTLSSLALVGAGGLGMTLLAVTLAVPPFAMLLMRGAGPEKAPAGFSAVTRTACALLSRRKPVVGLALLALVGLLVAQTRTTPGYNLTDHIPHGSAFRATLERLDQALPGSDQMFVVVEGADDDPTLSMADLDRLSRTSKAIFGSPWAPPAALDRAAPDDAVVRRFLGADGTDFALPVPARLNEDWLGTSARADVVRQALAGEGLSDVTTVTGYSLMSAVELPQLVKQLRLAFYIAVGLVTALAAVLMRSVLLALVSLVPNLIPILGVELWLILAGLPLTLTGGIALTIAFGIAVDDTIHLLNRLRLAQAGNGRLTRGAMEDAIAGVVPPVMITSVILLAGFALTAFSALPSVAVFGQLVAGALVLAILADIYLFPSLLLWVRGQKEDR